MKVKYPLTYEYLLRFKDVLKKRPGFRKYFDPDKDPFWTIYNVGTYSVAPHRVVYKELTDFFQAAVAPTDGKVPIADTKLRFIECESQDEAHFLCGLLNSSPAVLYLYATANWVQTADYQASDIGRLSIPRYQSSDPNHKAIVSLSRNAHRAAGNGVTIEGLQASLDEGASKIWLITAADQQAVTAALEDAGFVESLVIEDKEDLEDADADDE